YGSQSMSLLGLSRDLPFSAITAIDVLFSDDVAVSQSNLALTGVNVTSYSFGNFHYNPATHDATWTLPTALGVDLLMLALDGTGPAGVHAANTRIALQNNLKLGFAVLPGDYNGDGAVTVQDAVPVLNQTAAGTPYSVWGDV